jgi:hypothetical protein
VARIVGVHGVGNFDPDLTADQAAEDLAWIWADALRKRVPADAVDLRVAYYAPHLRGETGQSLTGDLPLPPELAEAVQRWAEALGAPAEVAQGYLTQPVRQFAEWVAARFGLDARLMRWFVATFLTEVDAYLRDEDGAARRAARDTVIEVVAAHRPQVVVAHSLGSVVAYEALHAPRDFAIDLFLTVGSPLAMPDVVLDRLAAHTGTVPRRPPGVRRWVNVADVGDVVAVPSSLAGSFAVDADLRESVGLFDFHRVVKYLNSGVVAGAIASVG